MKIIRVEHVISAARRVISSGGRASSTDEVHLRSLRRLGTSALHCASLRFFSPGGRASSTAVLASLSLFLLSGLLAGCQSAGPGTASWNQTVSDRARLYGHRNWIVIADSAYPAQSREGIETIATHAGQIEVVRQALATLDGLKHVRPIVYTDAELTHVPEQDAPGIEAYRRQLAGVLGNRPVQVIPHEQIIAKLDEAGATFRVLILKTDLALPYTSVFLQLDCGYWSAEAEKRLRAALAPGAGK